MCWELYSRHVLLSIDQVSNWFINARVRLWKPMVEEMYKEEAGEPQIETNSNSDQTHKVTNKDEIRNSDTNPPQQSSTSNLHIPTADLIGSSQGVNRSQAETHNAFGLIQLGNRYFNGLGSFGNSNGVSLTLGLQNYEGGVLPISGESHQSFIAMEGSGMYNNRNVVTTSDSMQTDSTDCEQHRFGSSHLLHDFVA